MDISTEELLRVYALRYGALMAVRAGRASREEAESESPPPESTTITFEREDITFDRSDITFDDTEG